MFTDISFRALSQAKVEATALFVEGAERLFLPLPGPLCVRAPACELSVACSMVHGYSLCPYGVHPATSRGSLAAVLPSGHAVPEKKGETGPLWARLPRFLFRPQNTIGQPRPALPNAIGRLPLNNSQPARSSPGTNSASRLSSHAQPTEL